LKRWQIFEKLVGDWEPLALQLASLLAAKDRISALDIRHEGSYISPRVSTEDRVELLQGTLDLLILRTLLCGREHGHAIAKAIERNSAHVLQVEQGSLYPALHRLLKRKWISAQEVVSENNRRANYYSLTAKGRRQLDLETAKWDKLAQAIARILRTA
jgi:PadR family transcriptional regulator, regulatory protein PadR